MEIKVGQWARFWLEFDVRNKKEKRYYIAKIYEVHKDKLLDKDVINYVTLEFDNPFFNAKYIFAPTKDIETADNLEDLLKIGDIVHYTFETGDGGIVETQTLLNEFWLEHITRYVKENKIKITAIELFENRVRQEIGSDSDE